MIKVRGGIAQEPLFLDRVKSLLTACSRPQLAAIVAEAQGLLQGGSK